MTEMLLQSLGWLATAAFACSYLFRKPSSLRVAQALAALLWIGYGVIIHAMPVIVSNTVVAGMALVSMATSRRQQAAAERA